MQLNTLAKTLTSVYLAVTCGLAATARSADLESILAETAAEGGLCVQLGGESGAFTCRLARDGRFVVHRLDSDAVRTEAVRRYVTAKNLYGPVTVEHWTARTLPYSDNLVNLVVVDDAMGIPQDELMRVLCPNGALCVKRGDGYETIRKARPAEMDEWTHDWHGADGNMMSSDTVLGVPNGVQWLAGPLFPLDGRKSSTQGLVSAGGRVFYITQNVLENLERAPGKAAPPNYLVARDAYNGVALWQRRWDGPVIVGTSNVSIVAVGERVYGAQGSNVAALDAATGKTLYTYPTPQPPRKILYCDGLLVAATNGGMTAFDTASSEQRWHQNAKDPYGTVVSNGRIFCIVGSREKDGRWLHEILCLDLETGAERWRQRTASEHAIRNTPGLRIQFAAHGVLCLVEKNVLRALSEVDGREVWRKETKAEGRGGWDTRLVGHFSGHGLIWLRRNHSERKFEGQEVWQGLDPKTGKAKRSLTSSGRWPATAAPAKMGCQPLMATERFIVFPRQATYVDFATGAKDTFKFARGGCVLGAIPANGLAYVAPHACGCFSETLRGFLTLTSTSVSETDASSDAGTRVEKGPAHQGTLEASSPTADEAWPTHRHDARRSSYARQDVPAAPRPRWTASIARSVSSKSAKEWRLRVGNAITSPTVAEGRVFVACTDTHRLIALDAEAGTPIWEFTAGGRIDTPPTIDGGRCLFGAHDGWVYCLRAADGRLAWRFRAAPTERRIVAFGQLESVWPVTGAVLVHDGLAYVAAGRAPDADGGIRVHAIEPETGRLVWSQTVCEGFHGLCDYLIADGDKVYLSNRQFDAKTGRQAAAAKDAAYLRGGKVGLLEASWTRIELARRKEIQDWTFGPVRGQLLAFSPDGTFGYRWTADRRDRRRPTMLFADRTEGWTTQVPDSVQFEAMALTPKILFAAGPADCADRTKGGVLWSVSTTTGKRLAGIQLAAPPVFDGLAVAYGRVYVATEDGRLLCFEGE